MVSYDLFQTFIATKKSEESHDRNQLISKWKLLVTANISIITYNLPDTINKVYFVYTLSFYPLNNLELWTVTMAILQMRKLRLTIFLQRI